MYACVSDCAAAGARISWTAVSFCRHASLCWQLRPRRPRRVPKSGLPRFSAGEGLSRSCVWRCVSPHKSGPRVLPAQREPSDRPELGRSLRRAFEPHASFTRGHYLGAGRRGSQHRLDSEQRKVVARTGILRTAMLARSTSQTLFCADVTRTRRSTS